MLHMAGVQPAAGSASPAAIALQCRSCGHTARVPASPTSVVWETRLSGGVATGVAAGSGGGAYTDAADVSWREATLPVSEAIPCPALGCPTAMSGGPKGRVVYRKVSPRDMTFLYRCAHCCHVWASGGTHGEK